MWINFPQSEQPFLSAWRMDRNHLVESEIYNTSTDWTGKTEGFAIGIFPNYTDFTL